MGGLSTNSGSGIIAFQTLLPSTSAKYHQILSVRRHPAPLVHDASPDGTVELLWALEVVSWDLEMNCFSQPRPGRLDFSRFKALRGENMRYGRILIVNVKERNRTWRPSVSYAVARTTD